MTPKPKNNQNDQLRSPICTVLGHVDHGKSSILDAIRGSAIISKEAGGITQAIGASIIPFHTIKKICGKMLDSMKMNFTIPGLLFIDTPGHAAFTSLRKRGGSLADIAIVVIDINEGFKPQTIESINILKQSKTPFIIAANKIDLTHNWRSAKKPILANINEQQADTITHIEKKLYELVGQIHEQFEIPAERFDRVDDFTKTIAIVPCSAKTQEGIAELIMVMTGLAQKYLEKNLHIDLEATAKGTVLEIKEEKGLGKTMDVILYDGSLHVGDTIIVGHTEGPIVAKVRALFEPAALAEMRDKKSKFASMKEVHAATGVKISAPGTEEVIAGMPIWGMTKPDEDKVEKVKASIQKDIEAAIMETEEQGIIIKADSLGSLEAMQKLLQENDIPIRKAAIGDITRKDIVDAESNIEQDPMTAVILGFNIQPGDDIKGVSEQVKILCNDVIYRLIEDYEAWKKEQTAKIEAKDLEVLTRPAKLEIMRGYIFRQNNPAVFGCHVMGGKVKNNDPLMKKDGKEIGSISAMQKDSENVKQAGKNAQVAVSMKGVTVGRQVNEGDILYTSIPEEHFRKLKELKKYLSEDEVEVIKEIMKIKREKSPVWGV